MDDGRVAALRQGGERHPRPGLRHEIPPARGRLRQDKGDGRGRQALASQVPRGLIAVESVCRWLMRYSVPQDVTVTPVQRMADFLSSG